jgi:hypothetical protein
MSARDLFLLLVSGLAAFGVGVLIFTALLYANRDEIAAWYRQLPVMLVKCTGAK